MTTAILTQCFYVLAYLSLTNGVLLLYLQKLDINDARIVFYLSLPLVVDALLRIPLAYVGDRIGKLKMGMSGASVNALGFAFVLAAGWLRGGLAEAAVAVGLSLFAVGNALYAAVWFALLSPIVPEHMRGRFFGRLRLTWQVVGILFALFCALFLTDNASLGEYRWLVVAMVACLTIRVGVFSRLPELEKISHETRRDSFRVAFGKVLEAPGYVSFCAYVFLISLCIGACPFLVGLVFKGPMEMSDGTVVFMISLFQVGSVFGYWLGGRLVDRWTTKPVFLICHFGFALVMFGFVCRGLAGPLVVTAAATAFFLYGFFRAASSIAISTEMLALIPSDNKPLATSLCTALMNTGMGLSGVLSSWALASGILNDSWQLFGQQVGPHDALLTLFAVMVGILVVTLGLVPSVLTKAEWSPRVTS